jgi:hypothetical protein
MATTAAACEVRSQPGVQPSDAQGALSGMRLELQSKSM